VYPAGIDGSWIGRDKAGHVAIFITAGEGPVPGPALEQFNLEPCAEDLISALPIISECVTVKRYPKMSSFEEPARRGFFAYDWSDVHESRATESGAYQLIARPLTQIRLREGESALGIPLENLPVVTDSFVGNNSIFVQGEKI
jgi:hypothetical protein